MPIRQLTSLLAMVLTAGLVMSVADALDWTALTAYLTLAVVAVPVIAVGVVYAEGLWPRCRGR